MGSLVSGVYKWNDCCQHQGEKEAAREPLLSACRCATDAVLMDWGWDMKNCTFASFKEGECE